MLHARYRIWLTDSLDWEIKEHKAAKGEIDETISDVLRYDDGARLASIFLAEFV